ncbi:isochorismatase family protein [Rheinheimera sp. UJ63]|uniref:isochorismatase family protein n=1 Tax=Rheinheimera sp. UJ63 TaxID=2910157 RepID=UPI001F1F8127|nr:isochorismatase family protein [Rheinheimera sp. UJ63]MCF4008970.1 isochorismatase family protein [Rheinheimera sp. UJ63]
MLQPGDLATGTVPFGHRPALIVVDMSYGFTSVESPLGGAFDSQVDAMAQLAACFRQRGWPIYFSTVVYHDEHTSSVFRQHLPVLNMLRPDTHWVQIDQRLAVQPHEVIVEKTVPSAFFNTGLAELLAAAAVDSVVIGGLTTSGCVRATVVDALQYNFPAWVIPETCGERNLQAHAANLHDMAAKYAEVVALPQALTRLAALK